MHKLYNSFELLSYRLQKILNPPVIKLIENEKYIKHQDEPKTRKSLSKEIFTNIENKRQEAIYIGNSSKRHFFGRSSVSLDSPVNKTTYDNEIAHNLYKKSEEELKTDDNMDSEIHKRKGPDFSGKDYEHSFEMEGTYFAGKDHKLTPERKRIDFDTEDCESIPECRGIGLAAENYEYTLEQKDMNFFVKDHESILQQKDVDFLVKDYEYTFQQKDMELFVKDHDSTLQQKDMDSFVKDHESTIREKVMDFFAKDHESTLQQKDMDFFAKNQESTLQQKNTGFFAKDHESTIEEKETNLGAMYCKYNSERKDIDIAGKDFEHTLETKDIDLGTPEQKKIDFVTIRCNHTPEKKGIDFIAKDFKHIFEMKEIDVTTLNFEAISEQKETCLIVKNCNSTPDGKRINFTTKDYEYSLERKETELTDRYLEVTPKQRGTEKKTKFRRMFSFRNKLIKHVKHPLYQKKAIKMNVSRSDKIKIVENPKYLPGYIPTEKEIEEDRLFQTQLQFFIDSFKKLEKDLLICRDKTIRCLQNVRNIFDGILEINDLLSHLENSLCVKSVSKGKVMLLRSKSVQNVSEEKLQTEVLNSHWSLWDQSTSFS